MNGHPMKAPTSALDTAGAPVEPQEHPVDAMPAETEEAPQAAQDGPSDAMPEEPARVHIISDRKAQAIVDGNVRTIMQEVALTTGGSLDIKAVLVFTDGQRIQLAGTESLPTETAMQMLAAAGRSVEMVWLEQRLAALKAGQR